MIRQFLLASLLASPLALAEKTPDLLRFSNSDRLHGQYAGFTNSNELLWKHDDISDSISLKTVNLHQLVLRSEDENPLDESISYVELINGDQVPGTVTSIDSEFVTIKNSFSGTLKIPRNAVSMIAPNPLGGPVRYHGPFSEKGWNMINPKQAIAAAVRMEDQAKPDADENAPGRWGFSGSAWYWTSPQLGTALMRKNCLPNHSIVRFKLEWRNDLRLAVALHADTSPASTEKKDEDKERNAALSANDSMMFPHLFGNSYVLQLNSNYIVLYRSSLNGKSGPEVKRINVNSSRLRLGQNSKATIEIRSNREKGNLALFIDDKFVLQWAGVEIEPNKTAKQLTQGSGLGFLSQTSDSSLKISDVVIAEWNGMPDSARNLGVDHRDIVMMTNGLDRYAGEIVSISDSNEMTLKGKYGTFKLPLNDISEIRFAKSKLLKLPKSEPDHISVRLNPLGIITGKPQACDEKIITLKSPYAGEITLPAKAAAMLEFNSKPSDQFDDWNIGQ